MAAGHEDQDDHRDRQEPAEPPAGHFPGRRGHQQDQAHQERVDVGAPVPEGAVPELPGRQHDLHQDEAAERGLLLPARLRRADRHDPGGDDDRQGDELDQVVVIQPEGTPGGADDVPEDAGDQGLERQRQVGGGVSDPAGLPADQNLLGQLQQDVHRAGYRPDQVRPPGPDPAPDDAGQPDHRDRDGQDQDGLVGEDPVGDQRRRPAVAGPPVGEDPGEHARVGEGLGGVPADADGQAEIGGEREPPQRVPPRVPREAGSQSRDDRHAGQVDHDEHGRQQPGVTAAGQQPRRQRVPDPGVPVVVVDGDPVGGGVPVERVPGEPVVELPVVARRRHVADARHHLPGMAERRAGHDEQGDVAACPHPPAGERIGQPGREREDAGRDRAVEAGQRAGPAGPRRPPGRSLSPGRSELHPLYRPVVKWSCPVPVTLGGGLLEQFPSVAVIV